MGTDDGKMGEEITSEEQLAAWVDGRPIHRYVRWIEMARHPEGGQHMSECTPDFSCCTPSLLATKDVREAFARAEALGDHSAVGKFLNGFLAKMLKVKLPGQPVRVAGSPPDPSWWEHGPDPQPAT